MRQLSLGVGISLLTLLSAAAQVPVAKDPQALQLLQKSLAALSPNIAVQDVTLSGSAHYIAGSDDETGTAIVKATAFGDSRIDLQLAEGLRTEIRSFSGNVPSGTRSDSGPSTKKIPEHNLLTESTWFFPAITIARRISGADYLVAYRGQEVRNSSTVEHLTVVQNFAVLPADSNSTMQHLTQLDLYLDSSTLLPASLTFNTHPDDDFGLDIPIEIRFSDYRLVNGERIPFHLQRFLNNGLTLDLQFDNATLNTGLSPTEFSVQ
jgi:hypothetical protein